jgi:hypothetical protein
VSLHKHYCRLSWPFEITTVYGCNINCVLAAFKSTGIGPKVADGAFMSQSVGVSTVSIALHLGKVCGRVSVIYCYRLVVVNKMWPEVYY